MADFKHEHIKDQTELLQKFELFEETFMRLQETYIRNASAEKGIEFDQNKVQKLLITDGERTGADQLERMERMYNKYGLDYTKRNYGKEHAREIIEEIHKAGGNVANTKDRQALIAEIDAEHISHHQTSEGKSGSAIDIRDDMFFKKHGGDEFSEQRLKALEDTAKILGFKAPHIEKDHIHLTAAGSTKNTTPETTTTKEPNGTLKQNQILTLQAGATEVTQAIENGSPQTEIEKKKQGFLGDLDGILGILAVLATALIAGKSNTPQSAPATANFNMEKATSKAEKGNLPTAKTDTPTDGISPKETPQNKDTQTRDKSAAIE